MTTKFNQKQYNLLKECSMKNDMTLWNNFVKDNLSIDNVHLEGADLSGAILIGANLREANLSMANLDKADLTVANLEKINLSRSLLHKTELRGANLHKANLDNSDLSEVIILKGNLTNASLKDADLKLATLRETNFSNAILQNANLRGADFIKANLSQTDLSNANLTASRLIKANLSNANITGAKLYGSSRDDWIIEGINCEYVYWDSEGKERTPKDRNFEPGEFEAKYKSLPEITYYFSNQFTPITPLIMAKVVDSINRKHPHFELQLDSFHSRGTPHAIFTVLQKEHSDEALDEITNGYEKTIQRLEGKIEGLKEGFSKALDKAQSIKIEHMVNTFNTTSGRDTNIATDQANITVTNSHDVINMIDKTIGESSSNPDDKADAKEQLDKMTQELSKPEPDKGRIKRCYDYVVGLIPKVAEVVPWSKLIEKTLGL
jgi:uncharacterized protein YjbI with pentapeptide repeats